MSCKCTLTRNFCQGILIWDVERRLWLQIHFEKLLGGKLESQFEVNELKSWWSSVSVLESTKCNVQWSWVHIDCPSSKSPSRLMSIRAHKSQLCFVELPSEFLESSYANFELINRFQRTCHTKLFSGKPNWSPWCSYRNTNTFSQLWIEILPLYFQLNFRNWTFQSEFLRSLFN